jgi:SH3-like domain-containing protein
MTANKNKKQKTAVILGSQSRGSHEFTFRAKTHEILESYGFKDDGKFLFDGSFLFFVFSLSIFFLFSQLAFSAQKIQEVNYFASLRAEETNVRSGPGQNYPIKFTFKLRGIPVRVISEYDNWNEIHDYEGQSGWVTQSLLTKKRTLMVKTSKSFINMHSKNNEKSRIIFRLENNVIGDYLKCVEDWCGIKITGKKGWVKDVDLFGGDEIEKS